MKCTLLQRPREKGAAVVQILREIECETIICLRIWFAIRHCDLFFFVSTVIEIISFEQGEVETRLKQKIKILHSYLFYTHTLC